ncbi:uncharacterized protein LOC143029879 [Oratosquilla oratoria]|uniref:uncharacterized protein LOC143029879 n=1 Tax=Oratosquilla oratoria TaxID=337810 RepID=UPI003F76170C
MDFSEVYEDTCSSVAIAVRREDVQLLKVLLREGRPTNSRDNRGWRPLHEAAARANVECIRLLLQADDVDISAETHEGETALLLACNPLLDEENRLTTIRMLLESGAKADVDEHEPWTVPLTRAVQCKDIRLVKLLVEHGADVNKADCRDGLPLNVAATVGSSTIIEYLLKQGADPRKRDNEGFTALYSAMSCHLTDSLSVLIEVGQLTEEDICAKPPDRSDGQLTATKCNTLPDGVTPLMLACQYHNMGAAFMLLERGADPDITTNEGFLALHFAVQFGSTQLVQKLVRVTSREKLLPKNKDCCKISLYHLAIEWDRFQSVKDLLDAGIPADSFLQETPEEVVDRADPALYRQKPLILPLGCTTDTPLAFLLSTPITKEKVNLACTMIDNGSSVNSVCDLCLPPLCAAVVHQRDTYTNDSPGLQIVKKLIDGGVNVLHKIKTDDPLPAALHVSALFNPAALFFLLQCGIQADNIYTLQNLEKIRNLYISYRFYHIYPMFPWRVISWLNIVNMFVPYLPKESTFIFDVHRMVEDPNLDDAWKNLDKLIGEPKTLVQLSVLVVRKTVYSATSGEPRKFKDALSQLTLGGYSLPVVLMDLLQFKQVESKDMYKSPPQASRMAYLLPIDADESSDSSSSLDEMNESSGEEAVRRIIFPERPRRNRAPENDEMNESSGDEGAKDIIFPVRPRRNRASENEIVFLERSSRSSASENDMNESSGEEGAKGILFPEKSRNRAMESDTE